MRTLISLACLALLWQGTGARAQAVPQAGAPAAQEAKPAAAQADQPQEGKPQEGKPQEGKPQ
ncbi:MAG: hypothetical protein V4582_10505, partial [Pseudomonadota bacterium]